MQMTGITKRSGQWYLQTIADGRLVEEASLRRVPEEDGFDVFWVGGPSPMITAEGEFRMLRLPDTPMYFQRIYES